MSSFTVHTPALAAAALNISANAYGVGDAKSAAQSAPGGGGTHNTPFPDPPQRNPAGITRAELEPDWQGYAAALDQCQSEINRLRRAWEKAKQRQAANEALALKLTTSITATAEPDDATRITTQANTASGQAHDAGVEADRYALRAHTAHTALRALTDFTQHASTYQSTLEGSSPGEAPGPLGTLFTPPRTPGTPADSQAAGPQRGKPGLFSGSTNEAGPSAGDP